MNLASHSKTNYALGVEAESACKNYLKAKGFEILAERYKTKFGEVDIIAVSKDCLVFAEIKRRQNKIYDDPISATQKKRIINSALQYLAENEKFVNFDMRFDCIFVDKDSKLTHIEDSWRIEEI